MSPRVRAAARVFLGCVALGVLGGIVWGFLTPAEHLLVVDADRGRVLTGESNHLFDAIGIYCLVAGVAGLWSAVATWQWRSKRGPVLYLGLLAGSVVGAAVIALVGELVAGLRFPHVDAPAVGTVVAHAPGLGSWLALVVQPLVGSMVFVLLAALNPHEDLGVGDAPAAPVGG